MRTRVGPARITTATAARASVRRRLEPPVPGHLTAGRTPLTPDRRALLTDALTSGFFDGDAEYLATAAGAKDLADHVDGRLSTFRERIVPWLDDVVGLDGARVLEIGCGTGASTVSLAEQGARVTAVDLSAASVEVARVRAELHDVPAEFHVANAVDVPALLDGLVPDLVVFVATVEHMTLDERLTAIAGTWRMLTPGGRWCLLDTPNRLWPLDRHTSLLPFFHWLPDELAIRYLRTSPRTELADRWDDAGQDDVAEFVRHGRGVSFHEFEIALGAPVPPSRVDSLTAFRERRSPALRAARALRPDRRTEALLRRIGPAQHPGFYEESLDLVIGKR